MWLTQSQIRNCEDYMRLEYGDEVADSVRPCLEVIRRILLVRKMGKILTAPQRMFRMQIGDKMMSTWTNMKVNRMVRFECNALKTHVTVQTIEGKFTQSVEELRTKLNSNHLLPEIRKVLQDMLDYAEGRYIGS